MQKWWLNCRFLTTKSRSISPASLDESVMSYSLCLRPLMIRLKVFLLTFFKGDGKYGFSTVWVGAILWNGCGVQKQNYFALLLGSEMTAGFNYRNWIWGINIVAYWSKTSISGLMVSKSPSQGGSVGSFPSRRDYEFTLYWMNLLLKTNREVTEGLLF